MSNIQRISLLAGLAVVSLLLGIWGGEEVSVFIVDEWVVLAGATIAGLSIPATRGRWARVLSPLGLLTVFALSVWFSAQNAGKVFQGCAAEAAPLHSKLKALVAEDKPLPNSLSDLGLKPPCALWLRTTMLEYEKTGSGFRLSFSGWLTRHTATESTSGFKVTK